MSEEQHNGWKNSETWLMSLYLDGNYDGEWTYREVLTIARSFIEQAELDGSLESPNGERLLARDLGEYLEEWVSARIIDGDGASIVTDLLHRSLGRIDWTELAENKLDEVQS